MDSYIHLSQKLETLIQNQSQYNPKSKAGKQGDKFVDFAKHMEESNIDNLRKLFPALSSGFTKDMEFKMLLKKRVFPYAWLDDLNKLYETKVVSKDDFYNDLGKESISNEEYQHQFRSVSEGS